ncbi:MAG: DivIVA domain-containing protein [Clostridia bacterium]|nr:DivIVA domain-containing protein [Clostridia bacterium]
MLTPLDIENKKFQRKMMNGYNVDEVDDFLDEITVDYERLYKENTELRAEIERSKEDLEKYKTIEQTLQNTLVMAQKTADDIKNTAQDEADNIIKNARAKMQESVDELTKESETRKREFAETKKQFDIYRAKMEALLISQLELLKDMKED